MKIFNQLGVGNPVIVIGSFQKGDYFGNGKGDWRLWQRFLCIVDLAGEASQAGNTAGFRQCGEMEEEFSCSCEFHSYRIFGSSSTDG